ncbi:MAG: hypothetical protein AMJ93_05580 [Anaerolineae bacterium SM23_84]|nr:MAG: hypothetical protein AMJ93_05580 [Anaerolineae bacterium SM23_84]
MSTRKRAPRGARIFGYAVALVVNLVMWYVFHNLHRWNLPFILVEEFAAVLPAVDLSLWAGIGINALWMVYDPRHFRRSGQTALNLLSLNSVYALYRVFPFDFATDFLQRGARGLLILAMIGIVVGTVVELARLFRARID